VAEAVRAVPRAVAQPPLVLAPVPPVAMWLVQTKYLKEAAVVQKRPAVAARIDRVLVEPVVAELQVDQIFYCSRQ
jgi:hypothetical protein